MTALQILLLLNAIWYAMGFYAFYVRRNVFGKVLVPNREHRSNSAYEALVESGRFMGGFNFALSALNVMLLFNIGGFESGGQWATLLVFNALAHGSQFAGNIPMALENRRGKGLWNVFKGVMLRIFVIDFVLMVANAAFALALFT
ncbi:MAG: hypothetical protein QNJ15_01065 [Erythrobacter sp.]|nr:hypothetical protein [Erythrobacter sp.]